MTRPRHNGHGGNDILRRAFDEPVADGEVDKRIPLGVYRTKDVRMLEEERRALGFSSGGSFERSTLIGSTCRHAMEKREGSSAKPKVPFNPPVLA
jgi:hypothetical protein